MSLQGNLLTNIRTYIRRINIIINSNEQWLDALKAEHTDHDYLPYGQLSSSITEYKHQIIIYIAGCVLKKKLKNLYIAANALVFYRKKCKEAAI